MNRDILTHYSKHLARNMTIRTYGHAGTPFLVFPCQDAMSDNFENFGMLEELSAWLEEGIIRLICVDTVDKESWSDVTAIRSTALRCRRRTSVISLTRSSP